MIEEQLVAAVVATVVGQAAEGLGGAARTLWQRLRSKGADDPAGGAALAQISRLPGPHAHAAALMLLRRYATDTDIAAGIAAAAREMGTPRQLPPGAAAWVDRDTELAAVQRLLRRSGRRRLVLLTGPSGVGKTALAIQAAAACADLTPHGQLYLNLRRTGQEHGMDAGQALGRLLRSLGLPPQQVPATVDEQAALWQTSTHGRQLLLMLDDAASAAAVGPLLPASPDCLVLITARTAMPELVAAGAGTVTVPPLDVDAAVELLDRIVLDDRVGDDLDAAGDLARACGGLPGAVTLTAATLACHPTRSLRQTLAVLNSDDRATAEPLPDVGGTPMTAALDHAYRDLRTAAARCYRQMAAHPPHGFTTATVAAALRLTRPEATAVLAELADTRLVDATEPDLFRYPAGAREHAAGLAADDPETPIILQRITGWYLAQALAAAQVLTPQQSRLNDFEANLPPDLAAPPMADQAEALAWLEQHRPTLVDLVLQTAPRWPELAFRLAYAMWALFHFNRHHHDRAKVDQVALDCARRLGNRGYEAAMAHRYGWGCYDRGDLDTAQTAFQRSVEVSTELGDVRQQGMALRGLGHVALARDEPDRAAAIFTSLLDMYTAAGAAPRQTALALSSLGQAQLAHGDVGTAIDTFTQAIETYAGLPTPDPYNLELVRIQRGQALGYHGQTGQARTDLDQALARMTILGSPRGQGLAHRALGELDFHTDHPADAARHLREAVGILGILGDREAQHAQRLLDSIPARYHNP